MKLRSIVIFGPAHAGKSTLAGYLKAKGDINFDFNKFDRDMKKNHWYDENQRYTYIFDRSIDERDIKSYRKIVGTKTGTSRYMAASSLRMEEDVFTIIDTPGAQHLYKEREKGIFLGDIGVFVIHINKLLDSNTFDEMKDCQLELVPLDVWINVFKKKIKPIIVISRMDLADYSQSAFDIGSRIIRNAVGNHDVDIVPVAIDRSGQKDSNVFECTKNLSWYDGKPLIKVLENYLNMHHKKKSETLFASLITHGRQDFTVPGVGKIWRWKMLDGSIKKDDTVKITPVIIKNKLSPYILADINNIQHEQGKDSEIALCGHVIGIDLNNILFKKRRVPKFEIEMLPSSCIISKDAKYAYGNVLKIDVSENLYKKAKLQMSVMILWFGNYIPAIIISKETNNEKFIIVVEIKTNITVSLPIGGNNKYLFRKFYLRIGLSHDRQKALLEQVEILCLGVVDFVRINCEHANTKVIKDKYLYAYDPHISGNDIIVHGQNYKNDVIRAVKRYFFKEVNEVPVDQCIGIIIKEQIMT